MKRIALVVGAVGALAIAFGCSDDTKSKTVDSKPVKLDGKGGQVDTGGLTPDNGGTKLDKGGTKVDGSGGSKCGADKVAVANSGKSCTTSATVCTADEACMQVPFKNAAGKSVKMCVGKCCVANPDDENDPAWVCPTTGNDTNAKAICGLQNTAGTQMYCTPWVCEVTLQGQTATFDCPDKTNYDCIEDTAQPGIKYCIAKL
jgi:hypothetical protein